MSREIEIFIFFFVRYNKDTMFPYLFGVIDSYVFMIVIGVIAAFSLVAFYFYYKKFSKKDILDVLICSSFAVALGVTFAILFQALYDLKWEWKLTFYGGLFGGVLGFLLTYFLFIKKDSTLKMDEVVKIAPPAITLAHGIGRIGCFLDGCCYGKETGTNLDMYFPTLGRSVLPTQLYEAIFLFILTAVLLLLVFRFDFKYTFIVYLGSYSIWRFVIEFFRDDPRGAFIPFLSPSQFWSVLIWIGIIPLYIFLKKKVFVERKDG